MMLIASENGLWESPQLALVGAAEWEKLFTAKKQLSFPRRAAKDGKT
jgi:hypothetical protein